MKKRDAYSSGFWTATGSQGAVYQGKSAPGFKRDPAFCRKSGETFDDLFQIGCIGLIKAIDNFDITQNVKFSTYAVPMILGEVRRYLQGQQLHPRQPFPAGHGLQSHLCQRAAHPPQLQGAYPDGNRPGDRRFQGGHHLRPGRHPDPGESLRAGLHRRRAIRST